MTQHDDVSLIPAEVFEVVRDTLAQVVPSMRVVSRVVDPGDVQAVARTIVENMRDAGYVTWPSRVPDRESLVLALVVCQREWEAGDVDGAPSLLEHLVDDMVLPLLRHVAGASEGGITVGVTGRVQHQTGDT